MKQVLRKRQDGNRMRPQMVDYAISIDRAFLGFAKDCGVEAEQLFDEAERAILMRHHDATPYRTPKGVVRPDVWSLDFGPACVIYALSDTTAYIHDYLCKANGLPYEPSQDLLAGMTETD